MTLVAEPPQTPTPTQTVAPAPEPAPLVLPPPDGTRPLEEIPIPGLTPLDLAVWLSTFTDPYATVGDSHAAISCPLANFVRHRLGLLQPAVDSERLAYTEQPPEAWDSNTLFWPRISVPLPAWAKNFVLQVDHSGCDKISAQLAKDILARV